MNIFFEALVTGLKQAIFKPKDRFERVKRNAMSKLLTPLVIIVGAESVLVSVLGAINSVQFQSSSFVFNLIGSSSSSFLTISAVVVLSFAFTLGANLYYERHIKMAESNVEVMLKKAKRREAYYTLRSKFDTLLLEDKKEEAATIAQWMASRYPTEVDEDSDFLRSLIEGAAITQLAQVQKVMIEAPRKKENET